MCAQQELGGAVPQRDDQLRELGRRGVTDVAGHAEICDLELAAVVQKEVGGLEIAVQDPVVVQISDTAGELEEECLDLGGEERLGHVFEDGFEVVFEEFEDEEDTNIQTWSAR